MPTRAKAWQHLTDKNNLKQGEYKNAVFGASGIEIAVHMAIANTGATGHFVILGAPIKNAAPAINPLTINLLDGDKLVSSHTGRLCVPWIPKKA